MSVDKIKPFNDPRVQLRSTILNGINYGYLYSEPSPSETRRGNIVLVHGFPDLSFGWRYQIPFLTSLGLTVVAIDCIGYGRTDSPPYTLADYGWKRAADDIATLCNQLGWTKIIIGGHDWGCAIVWRTLQYYPNLVTALFSLSAPYYPPSLRLEPLQILIRDHLPNLAYQAQAVSGEIEKRVQSSSEIRAYLNIVFSSLNSQKQHHGFDVYKGIDFEADVQTTDLLTNEELDFYTTEYSRHGLRGPYNYYRNREVNWNDEYAYFFDYGNKKPDLSIKHEVLYVKALNDPAITDKMIQYMIPKVKNLTYREVDSGHWIMCEKPAETNKVIGDWLEEKVFKIATSKL